MSEATRIIAFYGFKGGSGRSLLAANMAGVMAALGKRVLVIDCDLEAPGIGDYFDRPGEDIFTDSRSRKGILDLIVDRDVPPTPAAVTERLFGAQGLLVPADPDGRFLIEVARNGAGSIHLLGPGSHTNGEASAHHYLAKLINFDWNVFLGNNGGQFLAALGHALRSSSSPFDYVLLDARTGYNLPSVMLVRYLATDVVIVGTMAMQSIDGIARMEPLFSDIQGIDGAVKCHLVIGKDPSGKPPSEGTGDRTGDLETAFKASLIDEYHHALAATVYRLPFVDEFQRGDNLSWARLKADVVEFIGREEPAGAAAPATSTTGGDGERHGEEHTFKVSYCREFARLYRAVTGHELTKEHFTLVLGMWGAPKGRFNEMERGGRYVKEIEEKVKALVEEVRRYCTEGNPSSTDDVTPVTQPQLQDRLAPGLVPSTQREFESLPLDARIYCRLQLAKEVERLRAGGEDGVRPERVADVIGRYDLKLTPVAAARLRSLANRPDAGREERRRPDVSFRPDAVDGARIENVTQRLEAGRLPDAPAESRPPSRTRHAAEHEMETQIVAAIQHALMDSNDGAGAIAKAEGYLSPRMPQYAMYVEALALARLFRAAANTDVEAALPAIVALGDAIAGRLDRRHGVFIAPHDGAALATVNLFDGVSRYVDLAVRFIGSAPALPVHLDRIQSGVLARLGTIPLRADGDSKRALWQVSYFAEYVHAALRARRMAMMLEEGAAGPIGPAAQAAPHAPSAVLAPEDGARLLLAVSAPPLDDALRISDSYAALEGLRKICLQIELLHLSGRSTAAEEMLSAVNDGVLTPGYLKPAASEESKAWSSLLTDLSELSSALGDDFDAFRLMRAAAVMHWPSRKIGEADVHLRRVITGLAVLVANLGAYVPPKTIEELNTFEAPRAAPPAGTPIGRKDWWAAVELVKRGHYRAAQDLLVSERGTITASGHAYRELSHWNRWLTECRARLTDVAGVETALQEWRALGPQRVGSFSDEEGAWIGQLGALASATLAAGRPADAAGILDAAIAILERRTLSDRGGRLPAFRIRRLLAQIIAAEPHRAAELAREAADSATAAAAEYHKGARTFGRFPFDRGFAAYLGAPWRQEVEGFGMFSGDEFPAFRRTAFAETLLEYAEILLLAGRGREALAVANEVADKIFAGYGGPAGGHFLDQCRVAISYPVALCHAIRAKHAAEPARQDHLRMALSHRDMDVDENGPGRLGYYERLFTYCGVVATHA